MIRPVFDEQDIRALRAEGGLAEWLRVQMREGRDKAASRRALLLRHPDLAQRLTEPPLGYARPDQWNGSIPPEMWGGRPNDSPLRPVLLGLLVQAEAREAGRAA